MGDIWSGKILKRFTTKCHNSAHTSHTHTHTQLNGLHVWRVLLSYRSQSAIQQNSRNDRVLISIHCVCKCGHDFTARDFNSRSNEYYIIQYTYSQMNPWKNGFQSAIISTITNVRHKQCMSPLYRNHQLSIKLYTCSHLLISITTHAVFRCTQKSYLFTHIYTKQNHSMKSMCSHCVVHITRLPVPCAQHCDNNTQLLMLA